MGSGSQLFFLSLILQILFVSPLPSLTCYSTLVPKPVITRVIAHTRPTSTPSSPLYPLTSIVLCRGDVQLETCRSCINEATSKLIQVCPNQKEAIGWYELCMLRYSNNSINGTVTDNPPFFQPNPNYVTNTRLDQFNNDLRTLLDKLRSQASSGDHRRKFVA
ncbi:hypothetical protein ACSBR2_014835 [Camellia fascicularis]